MVCQHIGCLSLSEREMCIGCLFEGNVTLEVLVCIFVIFDVKCDLLHLLFHFQNDLESGGITWCVIVLYIYYTY